MSLSTRGSRRIGLQIAGRKIFKAFEDGASRLGVGEKDGKNVIQVGGGLEMFSISLILILFYFLSRGKALPKDTDRV